MGLLATLFLPITWTLSFLYANLFLILGALVVVGISAFLISYYLYGFVHPTGSSQSSSVENSARASPTPKYAARKVSTIHESVEDMSGTLSDPTTSSRTVQDAVELRRMRKRDWAKKIYRSLVQQDGRRTPSTDDSSEGSIDGNPRPSKFKRRHSTSGPLQMAKDLIRRGSRHYFRQTSEHLRERLPLPPTEFFEPTDLPEIPQNLRPEIFYILHNLNMLELPSEWKLDPREIEVRKFRKDEYIVKPGDQDDAIYVAIEGCIAVYIRHMEGKEYMVKKISPGNSFFSLLSMIDILMGAPSIFRTVSLKALDDSCTVAKFSIKSFRDSYEKLPEAWVRPIQIVVTRLLHVTMTTLHKYMGLSSELMRSRRDDVRTAEERARHHSGQTLMAKTSGMRLKLKDKKGSQQSESGKDIWADIKSDAKMSPEQAASAAKWFGEALGLNPNDALEMLTEYISVKVYEEGNVLVEQGSEEEQLMLVLNGTLVLSQEPVFDEEFQDDDESAVSRLYPKELVGGLQLLTNEPSFYRITAITKTVIAVIKKNNFATLLEAHPQIYLPVAHSVLRRLSPFLRGVDFALDWILVDSGHAVYRAGDVADSLYVVLSGRLRSVEKKTVVEEFGRGDVLGMMEVLQKKARSTTVMAVRFSQLARVPEGLLNFIKLQFPQVGFRLVQLLGQYYSSMNRRAPFVPGTILDMAPGDPMSHIKNLHTIAIVPASPDVPLVSFTCELYHALSANLRVLRLSSQKVASCLESNVLEKQADFRLMHWLNVQEDTYPLVIYECDYTVTNWTRRCLRQADAILVIGMGKRKPQKHTLMRELLNMNTDGVRTNKELILLWPEETKTPSGTLEWLKNSYFSGHHHIRAPKRMFQWTRKTRKTSRERIIADEKQIIEFYEKEVFWSFERHSDFGRLARILTGNAVGVVLGGGGARGASHVGVLRALREQNIPIDIVGGTSIGSLIGGLYAETPDPECVEQRARNWFATMSSLWRKIWDLTYAHSAMFTGAQFNQSVQEAFGERMIEDCWIPYFCITTDISTSEMRVHRSGPLWAYCRASMSLAGYLPPLCDPKDGHLLLDGGYVNNLPADVMRSMGARCVIAVDVGSSDETNLFDYGDTLSGLWVLWKKLNPWSDPVRILNMEEIQSRLAYVSCVRQLMTVKKAPYCLYLRPAIEAFKTLDFGKFNSIMAVGYEYGTGKAAELAKKSPLHSILVGESISSRFTRQSSRTDKKTRSGMDLERTSSFTDLAAAMSKIPVVRPLLRHSKSLQPGTSANVPGGRDSVFISDISDSEFETEYDSSDVTGLTAPSDIEMDLRTNITASTIGFKETSTTIAASEAKLEAPSTPNTPAASSSGTNHTTTTNATTPEAKKEPPAAN